MRVRVRIATVAGRRGLVPVVVGEWLQPLVSEDGTITEFFCEKKLMSLQEHSST